MGVGEGHGLCGKKILPAGVADRDAKIFKSGDNVSPFFEVNSNVIKNRQNKVQQKIVSRKQREKVINVLKKFHYP